MRSAYIVGLCLTTCLTSPAAAESWFRIATTDSSVDYADGDSVRDYGQYISVDVFRGFGGDGADEGYLKVAVDVACTRNEFRLTRATSYDPARQYLTADAEVTTWDVIAANSIAEQVRRFACDSVLRDSPVSNPFDDADEYWYYYGA